MDDLYLYSLIVGGFFVILFMFGGDGEADADVSIDADTDLDLDGDGFEADTDADIGAGPGFVDLLSLRALFLFAAFFGLTGTLLDLANTGEPLTLILALVFGLLAGLGGNYFIKRFAYKHVSSDVSSEEIKGTTGKVLVPFQGTEKGKILLIVKGSQLNLIARSLDSDSAETFSPGEEVVVVRTDNGIAEVVKPT